MTEAGGKILDSVKALILPELATIKQSLAVITTRLDGLEKRFDDLRQDMNVRFAEFREDIHKRLAEFQDNIALHLAESREDAARRQSDFQSNIDKRLSEFRDGYDKRLAEFRADLDKRMDDFRGDQNQRWQEFRSDLERNFETNRRDSQGRLEAVANQLTNLSGRFTLMEEDVRAIKEDMGYQKILINGQQRSLEELKGQFFDYKLRLEVLEKELTKKPRAVSSKKTAAS